MFERLLNILYPHDSDNETMRDEFEAINKIHRDNMVMRYVSIACIVVIIITLWGIL
jgi:hypothetical protein